MGLMITADTDPCADPAPLGAAAHSAIEAESFPLSDGNYRLILSNLFLDPSLPFQDTDRVLKETADYLAYQEGKILPEDTQWLVQVTTRLRDLAQAAQTHGARRILGA
jgi:hypothetical protein